MNKYNPQPNPVNIGKFDTVRLTFLTPRLVRIEYSENGNFENRATLQIVNRYTPPVDFKLGVDIGKFLVYTVETEFFTIKYIDNGYKLSKDNFTITFCINGKEEVWYPEKEDTENLGGTFRTLDNMMGDKVYKKNRFQKVELPQGLISKSGWTVIDDTLTPIIDITEDCTQLVVPRIKEEHQDLYFLFYGNNYKQALEDAMLILGKQPLPPRYTLGYWWSRYWPYTDKELEKLVKEFEDFNIPLDVLVIDMDWHLDGWTGYTWDRAYFPDPAEFLKYIKSKNIHVTLNIHPADGVGKHEQQFKQMVQKLNLNNKKIDKIAFDCTDYKFMQAYFTELHHPLEDIGVDFWWIDWQQGDKSNIENLDPLFWLNHLHYTDLQNRFPNKRALIMSRYGGLGSGRYPIGFSGDTYIKWETLQFLPYFTATASNVLFGYWSHDIGGHCKGTLTGELYTRWVQFGLYSPILRTHATRCSNQDRKFWLYGEPYMSIMIDAVRKRYELVPYIYTEIRKTYDTGVSLCHPLYYEYPDNPNAYKFKNEYFFGSKMIVSPITEPIDVKNDTAQTKVWIPEGKWFDLAIGDIIEGETILKRSYTIDEVPVFVPLGSVIPSQEEVKRLEEYSYKDLVFSIYSGKEGQYSLYEDDGISTKYTNGEFAILNINHLLEDNKRLVTISPIEGNYDGLVLNRTLELRLYGDYPPIKVICNNNEIPWVYRLKNYGWTYDGDNCCVVIKIPEFNVKDGIKFIIEFDKLDNELLNGLKGIINRLKIAKHYANITTHIWEREIALLAQTGNRISRNPANIENQIQNLKERILEFPNYAKKVINEIQTGKRYSKEQLNAAIKIKNIFKIIINEIIQK